MASIVVAGDTSGTVTLSAPATAGTTTLTLPTTSGTVLTSASTITPSAGTVNQAALATGVAGTGPAFSAYANAGSFQAITTSPTKIVMGAVVFDTNSNYSTANSRFTPTVAGYYQINGAVGGNVNTELLSNIYKNGSLLYYGNDVPGQFISVVSALVYMNGTTDYVELWGYSPSASNNIYQVQARTYFMGYLARSA